MQTPRQRVSSSPATATLDHWKLEDAKARLSEVVRRAGTDGPQLVTIRGKEAAVVLSAESYQRLLPEPANHQPLLHFLQSLELDRVRLSREKDTGRETSL